MNITSFDTLAAGRIIKFAVLQNKQRVVFPNARVAYAAKHWFGKKHIWRDRTGLIVIAPPGWDHDPTLWGDGWVQIGLDDLQTYAQYEYDQQSCKQGSEHD
jgi:hypothetical protein